MQANAHWDSDTCETRRSIAELGLSSRALGYRIDYGGHSVVLSGDTRPSESLIRFAKRADLLVQQVYYVDEATLRTSPEERIIVRHDTARAGGRNLQPRAAQAGTVLAYWQAGR